jgi:glucokinase
MSMNRYILAVDLGGTQIRVALCDHGGQIFRRVACLTHAEEGRDAVLERMLLTIAEAGDGIPPQEIVAVGIGAPGPVNPTTGALLYGPNLPGWVDVPLRNLVSERTGRPTFLGNDANLAALAERAYGAAHGIDDVVYLTISTGIGSGIICDGRLLLGTNGLAAEAGHMIVDPGGPRCGCGRRGCLEAVASGTAIARDVAARIKSGKKSLVGKLAGGDLARIDARIVSEAAQQGDRLAVKAFARAGRFLGMGIANLLHLFNPRMVVLGGSVTRAGSLLFDPMQETIRSLARPPYLEGLAIAQAALGDDVGLLGAVALAVQEMDRPRPLA